MSFRLSNIIPAALITGAGIWIALYTFKEPFQEQRLSKEPKIVFDSLVAKSELRLQRQQHEQQQQLANESSLPTTDTGR